MDHHGQLESAPAAPGRKGHKSNESRPKCAIWRPKAARIKRFSMVFQRKSKPRKTPHAQAPTGPSKLNRRPLPRCLPGRNCLAICSAHGPTCDRCKQLVTFGVSTDKQADRGVSLEAQAEKTRAMPVVHNAELIDIIVDGGESAKSLNRPGMARLLALVDGGEVQAVIIAKLDRLTKSVKDLCTLLERFERRGVALV